ncbi:hypothetical protein GGI12_004989, partial [Dipsacomyces acuminosporus]
WTGDAGELKEGLQLKAFVNQPGAPEFQLLIQSGGGVYVRSLIHDLGEKVDSAAAMVSLVRMTQGPLRLDRDTISVDDLAFLNRVQDAIAHTKDVIGSTRLESSSSEDP